LTADVTASELLISDYSGVVFDFLMLERPQILFAFDLAEYKKHRHLFGDYDALDFALHPRTTEALVDDLVSGRWQDPRLSEAASARRKLSLPPDVESYARRSLTALDEIEQLNST
jgi:CDP-glycerol glycerophosphotransferase (TagB/SpsB family)